MVIPRCAVVTGTFGTSDCSVRIAADSWPHPGLVELPNVVDATPRGRGLPRLVSVMCRLVPRPRVEGQLVQAVRDVGAGVVQCFGGDVQIGGHRRDATGHEMICHTENAAASSGGPRNATLRLDPSTTSNAGKPCKGGRPKRDSAG